MNTAELLTDGFERVKESVAEVADGLTAEQLAHRPGGTGNSIGWLLWHLTRVQDDHVAEVAGTEQIWTAQGWVERFALPFEPGETGYAQSSAEVSQVRVESGDLLVGYYDAVHARTLEYLGGLKEADLDQVVDERWDPPVTLGVRLVSVLNDDTQHIGQAAYVRGILP
ncbi:DinB family protein [Kineosporia rhizophila]|uniref:mycothiol transferase n=1 Tax=Kineosporia rhizophila TaxID=84633 RepID=UPI000AB0545E|nr:DinB family protein [Kineosporia rhizophila]MCE0535714.1 DinB family protein [Kineosporia rhizophila]